MPTDHELTEPAAGASTDSAGQRLDKWLWVARITKSRTLAAQLIQNGKVRLNRTRVVKSSQPVRPGDVLTIALRGQVVLLKVQGTAVRRGPAVVARQLYEEIGEPTGNRDKLQRQPSREPGSGRPSKRDRRLVDHLMEPE